MGGHAFPSLGLPFNPYDPNPLPKRLICTGAAGEFTRILVVVERVNDR